MDTNPAPREAFAFDPENEIDCETTLGELVTYINAERIARGKGKITTVVVLGLDSPYTLIPMGF